MKSVKCNYLLAMLSLGLFFTACDKDPVENTITITIEEPVDGENFNSANCSEIHVHVDVEASDENHGVEIILHPEGDVDDKIIDYDMHSHDKVITFEQEVDLCSYASGTCFHLEVFACKDHDCATRESADVEFCIE